MSAHVTRKWSLRSSIAASAKDDTPRGAGDSDVCITRTRDEEFWYSDGSIILVARDVEFRVYKGLLTRHSPVFRDMFFLPQLPASVPAECAEPSCPMVHLSDSSEDLRHILRVYMPRGGPRYIHKSCLASWA